MTPWSTIAGAVAFLALLGVRATSANRLVRRKLALSSILIGAGVLIGIGTILATWWTAQDKQVAPLVGSLGSLGGLLFAFAATNAIVTLAINPLRADRIPEHFPTIVQDAVSIGIFLVAGALYMPEKWLTLSAVGGFVLGFALQDTLGNLFAGLAIQMERPFRVGQWVAVGQYEGTVSEITWRATKLRTKAGNSVVLPNNVLSKEAISNYSEPAAPTRLFVEVGAAYDAAPNDVKAVLLQALAGCGLVLRTPAPEVLVADFGASGIHYRIRFWIADFGEDDRARDQVRTATYYALKRRAIAIPYPVQVQYRREERTGPDAERLHEVNQLLASIDIFAPLSADDRAVLAAAATERLYGAGEAIVRQTEPGDSMFVLQRGEVRIVVEPDGREVARTSAGGYFGEMSLLTGEARAATVAAVTDCVVLEVGADSFRRLAMVQPAVVEQVSLVVATRRDELERSRDLAPVGAVLPDTHRSFVARVRRFLGMHD
jgi:small-conductance mechanosensitive channel/CRP-like cAMP-binding protein